MFPQKLVFPDGKTFHQQNADPLRLQPGHGDEAMQLGKELEKELESCTASPHPRLRGPHFSPVIPSSRMWMGWEELSCQYSTPGSRHPNPIITPTPLAPRDVSPTVSAPPNLTVALSEVPGEPRGPDVPKDEALQTTPAWPALLIGNILQDLASCRRRLAERGLAARQFCHRDCRPRVVVCVFAQRIGGSALVWEVLLCLQVAKRWMGFVFFLFLKARW